MILKMMLTILFAVALPSVGAGAPDDAGPSDRSARAVACATDITSSEGEAELPPGYGFDPAEFDRVVERLTGARDELKVLARLARFAEDPDADNFFELLGSYAGAGFAPGYFTAVIGGEVSADEQRKLQVKLITRVADQYGYYPRYFGESEARLLAEALGPLDTQAPVQIPSVSVERWRAKLAIFRRRPAAFPWPSVESLALHSMIAQYAYVSQVTERFMFTDAELLRMTQMFQRRLQQKGWPETTAERIALDNVEGILDSNPSVLLRANGRAIEGLDARRIKKEVAVLVPSQVDRAISQILATYVKLRDTERSATQPEVAFASPFYALNAFEVTSKSDIFSDQGHAHLLRRLVSELVLDRRALSGAQTRQRVRALLQKRFKSLRAIWRPILAANTVTPPAKVKPPVRLARETAPSRDERRRAYVERRAEVETGAADFNAFNEDATEGPATTAPNQEDRHAADVTGPWASVLDWDLSLEEARRRFANTVEPDVTLNLHLLRTGYTYRVALSGRLIYQLLNPARGQPTDLRRWLEALRRGPARRTRQRGWKKLAAPIERIYTWEIKIARSPYRILGYQTQEGAWNFDKIALLH